MKNSRNNNYRGRSGDSSPKSHSKKKGDRNTRNSSSADEKGVNTRRSVDGTNLFAWYNANPALTQSVSMLPFPYRPGMSLNVNYYDKSSQAAVATKWRIPGIMSINFYPSIGFSENVTDPASLVAKEMYGRVRSSFSGTLPEDAPDLLLYVMAMDSIFMAISHLKRIYRIISTYTPYNYDIPNTLLRMVTGCNATDVEKLPALKMQLFQYVNELIAMTEKLHVPAIMDIFNRHVWMCDNVYLDDATPNSQAYVFRPMGFYQFALDTEGKGCLNMTTFPIASTSSLNIVERWYEFVRGLIESLANSEDAYTISGHLMRAYEGVQRFRIDYLVINEPFAPLYVPEVLMQIENSKCFPVAIASLNVKQEPSTNAVISMPTATYAYANEQVAFTTPIISLRTDNPTVEMIVEASRLSAALTDPVVNGTSSMTFNVRCGSEVVVDYSITSSESLDTLTIAKVNSYDPILFTSTISSLKALRPYLTMESWDWHPILMVRVRFNNDGSIYSYDTLLGDVHNVTTCEERQLAEINKICLLSEFNAFANGI
nr:capsid protein [Rat picobirnavirus]